MYIASLKTTDERFLAYELCYNEKGTIIGVVSEDGDIFYEIDLISEIYSYDPKQIYPPIEPVTAPTEPRPFKVGDKVKLVSLENTFFDTKLPEKDKRALNIGHVGTITNMYGGDLVVIDDSHFTYSSLDLQHID